MVPPYKSTEKIEDYTFMDIFMSLSSLKVMYEESVESYDMLVHIYAIHWLNCLTTFRSRLIAAISTVIERITQYTETNTETVRTVILVISAP